MKRKEAKVEMMLMEMAMGRRTEPELGAGGREDSDSDQGKSTLQ